MTPYLMLAGPTASGKTATVLAIAERMDRLGLGVEIISVDSALVYRHMNIGTAKPSPQELAAVPHHLIDILEPTQAYSAAAFVKDVAHLLQDIQGRGKLPILTGGTMMYFKAWLEGMDEMPASDPQVRAAIEAQAQTKGWPALHAELAKVDPVTAQRLEPHDAQRIQRALEVFEISGQPLSSFHNRRMASAMPAPMISLEPEHRAWLHERIAQRFDAMLAQGLMEEISTLRLRGDLTPNLPSMRCVGYRQGWEALDGLWPMAELRERGIAATRQLAKRQITWLRSMPERRVVHCDAPDALGQVLRLVDELL
ncbi:MAG: tRNA (adenosine(37)-N6)-dimethylallyltransferase MiaA [Betaproteobacteria bacterium]|nr:tRNA (adenosine(37)-N6)-dimethylallyltransferase MiaA [Betaproteobacteria bacterium]